MNSPVAWSCGGWISRDDARLAPDDLGFLQGATLVERLRTCRGVPLDAAAHLARLELGCQALGIVLPGEWQPSRIVAECAERNRAHFCGHDFGIVVLVTPGRKGGRLPSLVVHPVEIAWRVLAEWYQLGQPLIIAGSRNVPPDCWSPQLKTRSRLHYYLADRQAAVQAGKTAGSILLDLEGNLTETSTANVIIVEERRLVCPPTHAILPGISLQRTLRLAGQDGWYIAREPISVARATAARELLLCGSTGCLWPAQCLNQRKFPAKNGQAFAELSRRWMADIDLDYIVQAESLAGIAGSSELGRRSIADDD